SFFLGVRFHVDAEVLDVAFFHRGPVGEVAAVRVTGLDEVGEVFLHQGGDFVVVRGPFVDFVGVQVAHCVFDFRGVDGAGGGGRRCGRGVAAVADDAAGEAWSGVAHRGGHLWPGACVVVAVDGFATGGGAGVEPFPGAVGDEAIASEFGGHLHHVVIAGGGV